MVQYLHLRILEFPLTYPISIVNFRDGDYDHEPNIYRISFPYYPTMTSFILWFFNEAMEIIMFNRYIDYYKTSGIFHSCSISLRKWVPDVFPWLAQNHVT